MVDIIFAPYFTKDIDYHQHDSTNGGRGGSKPDDYNLIKPWYESVCNLQIKAVIFHNELSEEFTKKYTNEYVSFHLWSKLHRPSYNDERFFTYQDYLKRCPEIERIVTTDLFDVQFFKNPFTLMDQMPDKKLFLGSERLGTYNAKWMLRKHREMYLPLPSSHYEVGKYIYNAGIVGGYRTEIVQLFKSMIVTFKRISKRFNANMPVYNYCVDKMDSNLIFTGSPLHNVFKSNQITSEVFIKHK